MDTIQVGMEQSGCPKSVWSENKKDNQWLKST